MDAVARWLAVADRLAPTVVEGLYLVGSAALDDWQPSSDIDVVAFAADPTDAVVIDQIEATHLTYRSEHDLPTIDGPVLAWADVTAPPISNQRPWILDGAFRFDGDCFEINPVTWYSLATYGVAARGDAASSLGVHLDRDDRERWCRENLRTYWRAVRDQVVEALAADPDRTEFPASMTEWCALGVARMAYTIETGDVASKSEAGRWAVDRHPAHAAVITRAIEVRNGAQPATSDRTDVAAVAAWMSVLVG